MNTHYPAHALRIADYSMILRRNQPPVFGHRDDVLTPAVLGAAFGVDLHIGNVHVQGRSYPTVLPLRTRNDISTSVEP
jgi:ABC-type cobalamin/Fe3+-siderophores transport systems, ATPase components